jgi:polyisoprenoid-binding protein YceI
MRTLSGALILVLSTTLALAADGKYTLTGENTRVEFTGTKPEGKHDGGFKALTGTAVLTGSDPATARITVTIETDSLYSDNPKLTAHLKNPDFFDVKTYKTAKFESTTVEPLPDRPGVYKVSGKLTMLDRTKEISFPAKISTAGGTLRLDSEFKINRTDFGMTYGKGKIHDDVHLRVKIEAK